MRKDELLADLEKIDSKRKELWGELSKIDASERIIRAELAEIVTSLVAGDIVTYEGAKSVWWLSRMHYNSDNWIEFYGFKLRKDGSPSLKEERIYGLGGPMFRVDK